MADTLTAKLGAVKPEVGASADTWGTKQNAAFDIFDAAISGTPATVASATTTDLAATTVPTINISGSVTITGFGNAVSGMIRKIIFGAAPLLTNGATLLMPGGVSRQMAAGDTCEVICLGTSIWKVFNIQPNQAVALNPNPVGTIVNFGGIAAPSGWVFCNGQALSRTTYAALYAVIGTQYGLGDGSTTFNTPDCRGRAIFGQDDMGGAAAGRVTIAGSGIQGDAMGSSGGAQNVVLGVTQLPAHTHTGPSHTHASGTLAGVANSAGAHTHSLSSTEVGRDLGPGTGTSAFASGTHDMQGVVTALSGGAHTHVVDVNAGATAAGGTGATGSVGSDLAHNNMPPSIIANTIIYAGV